MFFISVAFLRSFLNTKKGRDYIQVVGDFQVGGLPSKWWEEAGEGGGGRDINPEGRHGKVLI